MSSTIYDARFAFNYDNPFENDPNRELLSKLKKHFLQNPSKFTELDWCADSRYLILQPGITELYGSDVTNGVADNKLTEHIKSFINNVTGISPSLKSWCAQPTTVSQPPITTSTYVPQDNEYESETTIEPAKSTFDFEPNIIPSIPPKFSQSLNAGLHYDISGDRALTYDSVCKLCLNIARTKLAEGCNNRDETIEALEREKRKQLTNEIIRYKNNKLIAPLVDDDLSEMSLEQLETCLEQCMQHQETFKTVEIFKRSLDAGGIIYDAIFPEGIPLGKNRKLCFKGIGKEVLSTLFNSTTTTGIAFQNILRKHNVHVSDEVLTLVAFAQICISKIEIKKVDPDAVPIKKDTKLNAINADDKLMSIGED